MAARRSGLRHEIARNTLGANACWPLSQTTRCQTAPGAHLVGDPFVADESNRHPSVSEIDQRLRDQRTSSTPLFGPLGRIRGRQSGALPDTPGDGADHRTEYLPIWRRPSLPVSAGLRSSAAVGGRSAEEPFRGGECSASTLSQRRTDSAFWQPRPRSKSSLEPAFALGQRQELSTTRTGFTAGGGRPCARDERGGGGIKPRRLPNISSAVTSRTYAWPSKRLPRTALRSWCRGAHPNDGG